MIDKILSAVHQGRFMEDIHPVFTGDYSVVPGFVDTHAHMAEQGFFLRYPSLAGIKSKKALLEFVDSRFEKDRLNVFVDYDESLFSDDKTILKTDLDRISTDTPIVLRRVCGHIAILNTPAIKYFRHKIPEETLNENTGVAVEFLPLNLYEILSPGVNEIEEGILKAQERYLKKGITGILDFAKDLKILDAYLHLDSEGRLKIKVAIAFYESAYPYLVQNGFATGWKKGRVKIEGIKLFLDGSIGGRTASFYVPYNDSPNVLPFYTVEKLKKDIKRYEKSGFRVLMHAIGTRAINTALSAIPDHSDFNHRIEHFEFPDKRAIETARKKRVYISMQPNFVARWWRMYQDALKEEVFILMHPYKSMIEEEVIFAFGSDSMPEGPLYGIEGAVNHPITEERLTFKQSLLYYTEKGAEMLEIETGKMAKGCYADFLILNSNGSIKSVFVEGKKLYDRGNN